MNPKNPIPASVLVVLLAAVFVAATAFGQSSCPPGNSQVGSYCQSSSNPPPSTPPAEQPPEEGKPATVAGTLNGGTKTVEVSNSSTDSGTTSVALNIAGAGTLIVKAGDQTLTLVVKPDGSQTLTTPDGTVVNFAGAGGLPGTIQVTISASGISYSLTDPGEKTISIGKSSVTVPGEATITKNADATTYDIKGAGDATANLDPNVENHVKTGNNVASNITSGNAASARGKLRAGKKGRDVIRTGNLRDRVSTGPGADVIRSRGGNDRVLGGGGADVIYGGAGNDTLLGNLGDDIINGGAGNDTITGGAGRDIVNGGPGNDRIYNRSNGPDTINCGSGRDVVFAGPADKIADNCEVVHRY